MSLFISFEGPDGSGKSTQSRLLAETLRRKGHRVTETREPGSTKIGEQVRELLLDVDRDAVIPLVQVFFLSTSRAQLTSEIVLPALARGEIVITDRWADSTLAYQGAGFGVDETSIRLLTKVATQGIQPDVTVYVDVSPEVGLARVAERREPNRLDVQPIEFHRRVRSTYQRLAASEGERWVTVDGEMATGEVQAAIMRSIEHRLPQIAETA